MGAARISLEGFRLRFGEADTPVPEGVVDAASPPRIVAAAAPVDPRIKAYVKFRVDDGPEQTVTLRPERRTREEQFFEGLIPGLRNGDNVEYSVCAEIEGRDRTIRLDSSRAESGVGHFQVRAKHGGKSPAGFAIRHRPVLGDDAAIAPRAESAFSSSRPELIPSMPARAPARGTAGNGSSPPTFRVDGTVSCKNGLPAGHFKLRLYSREFGGGERMLAEGETDDQGAYAFAYQPKGKAPSIEVRGVDPDGRETPLSAVRYGATPEERIDVVLPATLRARDTEFERLKRDLVEHVADLDKLAEAQENDKQRDLTLLHKATGWDARLIGHAASAVKLAPSLGMSREAVYALLQGGLPSDTQQLAFVSEEAVGEALAKARAAGVVNLSDSQVSETKSAFSFFVRKARREAKLFGGHATFGDFLDRAGLTEAEEKKFEDLVFARGREAADFWKEARAIGGLDGKIERLRLQSALYNFTLGNARLADALEAEIGTSGDPARLVEMDLYRADAWKARLSAQTGSDEEALRRMLPPTIEAKTLAERVDAYAQTMADTVHRSFPTHVVGRMIENGELPLGERDRAAQSLVPKVFKNVATLGFDIRRTSLAAFLRENEGKAFDGIAESQLAASKKAVERVYRLYQTSPNDGAFRMLLSSGLNSACEIAGFKRETFTQYYSSLGGAPEEASAVFGKAVAIKIMNLAAAVTAAAGASRLPIRALSSPEPDRIAASNLIKHFPTMEQLLGSLDFCECEHCRSVLSPAAYFVDLLQFLEREETAWRTETAQWRTRHNGASYPFKTPEAQTGAEADWARYRLEERPFPDKTPYDVLIYRRPDLPHLPLTCENTNTTLPYIDIVNEILEYYVARGKLGDDSGKDTGAATSPELLAEPQHILPEAYQILRQAHYPLTIPFDLWLETSRLFLRYSNTSLCGVMDIFRPTDQLLPWPYFPLATSHPYYRRDILLEKLDISPEEYNVYTDHNLHSTWFTLYGYDSSGEALPALRSAKTLSRRLGVTYHELADIVQTSFVNPALDEISIVWKLGVGVNSVIRYLKEKGTPGYAAEQRAFEDRVGAMVSDIYSELYNKGTVYTPPSRRVGFGPTLPPTGPWRAEPLPGRPALTPSQKIDAKRDEVLAELSAHKSAFDRALVLWDTSTVCSFDEAYLAYADSLDPANAYVDDVVLLKINLFVRLWRRLGWTIYETDQALRVFVSSNPPPTISDIGWKLERALICLAHLKALDEILPVGNNSRSRLLTFWSNIQTAGKRPLYDRLFLTRSVLKNDPVFDDPFGRYLSNPGLSSPGQLKLHLPAVRGAFGLTGEDIGRILADAETSDDPKTSLENASLSIETLSLLYRYAVMAKGLKLPVRDVIALKQLSGLNPFTPFPTPQPRFAVEDNVLTETLRFVEAARKVRDSGFSVEDLDYLLRHRIDPVGKYRGNEVAFLALVRSLISGVRQLRSEHAIPTDEAAITDDLLRQKLALILPADVVDTFLGMWTGTIVFEASVPLAPPGLDASKVANGPSVTLRHDGVMQHLTYRGVLLDDTKRTLDSKLHSADFSRLLDDVQNQAKTFFGKHFAQPSEGFFTESDFETLFQSTDRRSLAVRIFPYLEQQLRRRLIIETLGADLNGEPQIIEALLTDTDLLHDPQLSEERGVSASYYTSNDATGSPSISTSRIVDTSARLSGTNSVVFRGYLEVATPGAYRIFVVLTNSDALVEFRLDDVAAPLIRRDAGGPTEVSAVLDLGAGVPRPFTMQVLGLGGGNVVADIEGQTLPRARLGDDSVILYPHAPVPPLLASFVPQPSEDHGISVSNYTSNDATGTPQTSITPTIDTTGKPSGINSAVFKGYLEVAAPGPYRIFVILTNSDALVEFRVDQLADPLIRRDATGRTEVKTEVSAVLELKAGVPTPFTMQVLSLGAGDVAAEIQSQTLPRLRLGEAPVTLYPQSIVEQFRRARTLLAKALQLISGFGLGETEARHLLSQRQDFEIDLSKLPTSESEPDPALFGQFLRFSAYARLRREMAGGSDDLISVFKLARRTYPSSKLPGEAENDLFAAVCKRIAEITRRDAATVEDAARELGMTATSTSAGPDLKVEARAFTNEEGLARLWQVLQVVEATKIPAKDLNRFAGIRSMTPDAAFAASRDLRNAVKSRYGEEDWQRVARPIFNSLRQRQRDALVAYVMHTEEFDRVEQLFEYFLIDPAMEPVVQTSRLRLAISSVQLFIQRCFLGLEPFVAPSVLTADHNADHWRWMKQYRVWEANRKIFLYPENWLEPEFRDDRTHLFRELEGTLLQDDVSNDLAETAFYTYLKGLEEIARLEIVSMYHEKGQNSSNDNILHVIGRTYNEPKKYFYRRRAHGMWTPWEPVTANIEGDHIVAVVWHGRLHLFWLTFLNIAGPPDRPKMNAGKNEAVTSEYLGKLVETAGSAIPISTVQLQLNWCEYASGAWSSVFNSGFKGTSFSTEKKAYPKTHLFLFASLDSLQTGDLVIHVVEMSEKKEDGHPKDFAFYILNKNSPQFTYPGEIDVTGLKSPSIFLPPFYHPYFGLRTLNGIFESVPSLDQPAGLGTAFFATDGEQNPYFNIKYQPYYKILGYDGRYILTQDSKSVSILADTTNVGEYLQRCVSEYWDKPFFFANSSDSLFLVEPVANPNFIFSHSPFPLPTPLPPESPHAPLPEATLPASPAVPAAFDDFRLVGTSFTETGLFRDSTQMGSLTVENTGTRVWEPDSCVAYCTVEAAKNAYEYGVTDFGTVGGLGPLPLQQPISPGGTASFPLEISYEATSNAVSIRLTCSMARNDRQFGSQQQVVVSVGVREY